MARLKLMGAGTNASEPIEKSPDRRKLVAIMFIDMVGYSRLIGLDDAGTLQRLRTLRNELIDPAIEQHSGKVVQTGGDSLLIVFDSIDGAVQCAVKVQERVPIHDGDQPTDRAIRFRVGINIGDAIADGTDLHGDAVNVAARLQAECPTGGICVSRPVRDHTQDRLELVFEQLGALSLKNIARPVEAFVLQFDAARMLPRRSTTTIFPDTFALKPRATARLSIVVLPFTNLGYDPAQEYFVDGITEDVTTDLSRIAHMTVISRNTAFTYKNKVVTTRQIGRELGVRYILEGSIRHSGNRIRANAQLIDAETDAHLWAERFDLGTSDLFALQNEVAGRIAVALNQELIRAETTRPTEHPDALDCILRGRAAFSKPPSREKYAEAIGWLERALALDPQSVAARSWLALAFTGRVMDSMSDTRVADAQRAELLTGSALPTWPHSPLAHHARGQVLRSQDRFQEAIPEFETVLSLDRNWVNAYHALGQCKCLDGAIEETILLEEQAIRLSPRDPMIGNWYRAIGRAHLLQSRIEEAIFWLERARTTNPALPVARAYLASAYALKGNANPAEVELAEARRLSRHDQYSSIAHLKATQSWGVPKVSALFEATYFAGLRKAGVPEG
jgi:TolB-like protein/class 3 adenylate cyclase/Tfp pilus assembly protein PilF